MRTRLAALLALVVLALLVPPAAQAAVTDPARGTTVQATGSTVVYRDASTSSEVIARPARDQTAVALGSTSGSFVRVYFRGHDGWTSRSAWNAVPGIWVNGRQLSADQEAAVRWLAANTINRVGGSLSEKLTKVSRAAWWSLKEAVFSQSLSGVHRYSNCENVVYDPLYDCYAATGGLNWQVGIGAVYVANASADIATVESIATSLYPGQTVNQVLAHTATYAGYPAGSSGYTRIMGSTGYYRLSWLLRNHGVGVTYNQQFIDDCLPPNAVQDWCLGDWPDARAFAPDLNGILLSIADLRAILYAIRPL